MSDEGEKSCPLCAEEMDLTDQQLRPCKCGYEICVWCWHHIMDMAEKDETEGRCPACRTPYDKEKIVGTTAKCERLVSEMTAEKKLKSQKGKNKTLEERKQLGSARVIQRNLVYVVGLPLNFADEDLLQRREYFGQYGKVLKVSISRTATGSIQQFANTTCSVYITYSKEEEAVRCIQMVHGFTLDGRPLRACFGTTKYCHAWLRNVPCTNPDCLYLHEIGSQEDSFTKDEVISAYTRSRIQQVTSSSNNIQRRSGNVLPSPVDECCNNGSTSSAKPMVKTPINTNNPATSGRTSPPNNSSGRSAALPAGASWGARPSSSQPLLTSTPSLNGPLNQKTDLCNASVEILEAVQNQVAPLKNDTAKKNDPNEESVISLEKSKTATFVPVKKESDADGSIVSDISKASVHLSSVPFNSQLHSPPRTKSLLNTSNIFDSSAASSGLVSNNYIDNNVESACFDILSPNIKENQHLQNGDVEHIREPSICQSSEDVKTTSDMVPTACAQSDFRLGRLDQVAEVGLPEQDAQSNFRLGRLDQVAEVGLPEQDARSNFRLGRLDQVAEVGFPEQDDDLLSFHKLSIEDPEIASNRAPDFSDALNPKHSDFSSPVSDNNAGLAGIGFDGQFVDRSSNLTVSTSNFPSVHLENIINNGPEDSNLILRKEKMSTVGRYKHGEGSAAIRVGESSIISNILSMDLDSWDEPVTSSQKLAKFLGVTNGQEVQGSWRTQNSGQSRFSFAREEESMSRLSHRKQSTDHEHSFEQAFFGHNDSSSNRLHLEKSVFSAIGQDYFASSHSHMSSNKLPVSRPQVSAPPGFSVPSRAAPPGFTSHRRTEQIFESHYGNYTLDASSLLRNQHQVPSSGDIFTNGDIEFMDPAILAVGKGTYASGINNTGLDIRTNFPPQFNAYDEARFQSILQRSMPPHHNQRFSDLGDSLSTHGDVYGIPSRIVEQTLSNNLSPFSQFPLPQSTNGVSSNGQWDGWSEAQSVNHQLGMAELLRSKRLGFSNKFYGGYEESKMRMPDSGHIYNGTYGI